MSEQIKVIFIGWEDDYRYAEEKSRIEEHIIELARTKGFASALVLSVSQFHPENELT